MSFRKISFAGMLLFSALGAASQPVAVQDFPSRPLHIIVPYAAGGNTDVIARLTGQKLAEIVGQAVIVENRAGGGTIVGSRDVAQSPPDGYTLLVAAPTLGIVPWVSRSAGYHVDDFAAVAGLSSVPWVLSVARDVPANTLAELIAYAKANPGKVNNGAIGLGSSSQLLASRFKTTAGIELTDVPYNGAAPALKDLVAGTVQLVFDGAPTSVALYKGGQIKILATSAERRLASAPEVPTFRELGFPKMTAFSWFGLFVPARTPLPVRQRLGKAVVRVIADPAVKERFAGLGTDPWTGTPEEFTAFLARDFPIWEEDARRSGIHMD